MDCSPAGSSVHGDSPAKNTGVGCHALLQEIFPTHGLNPVLPHCRWILYHLSHQKNLSGEWSSWIELSEWCLLYFLSQMSPLNWISYPFLPWFVKFPSLPASCPQRVSLHSLQPIFPTAENVTKKIETQILLKKFSSFSPPPGPRFQDLPWVTPVFLLTLISLPPWTSFRAWHHTFPPSHCFIYAVPPAWGALLPTPCSTSSPSFHLDVQYSLLRGVFPNPSISPQSTCIHSL